MRMISLWQPFASLIFTVPALKTFETRSFAFPKNLTGERIAIHATAKATPPDGISTELDDLCKATFGSDYLNTLPRSAILGMVGLVEAIQIDDETRCNPINYICGDWTPGRYAWRLERPTLFPMPIPQKGKQGWKELDWL